MSNSLITHIFWLAYLRKKNSHAGAGADRKEIANRYFQWSHFHEAGTDAGAYTSFFKLQIMYVFLYTACTSQYQPTQSLHIQTYTRSAHAYVLL